MSKALISPRAVSPKAMLFGLPAQEKVVFYRQLATMVGSGLSIGRAASTASQQGKTLSGIGNEIASDVDSGSSLSGALTKFPYHFDSYELAMIKAGEASGQLDIQLKELANSLEANWILTNKISSKLVYPIIILHAAILLPPLFLLVKDGIEAYLKTVLAVLIPLYLLAAGCALSYRLFRSQGGPRRLLDHLLAHTPILGPTLKLAARIRFLDLTSSLIEAGLLPDQAIPLAADSCNNFWLRDAIILSWQAIGKESPISQVLRQSRAFSTLELGLVVSGEESGSFASTLKKAADSLRPDFEAQVHRLATILPILLLLAVGGVVGFIAVKSMVGILAPLSEI